MAEGDEAEIRQKEFGRRLRRRRMACGYSQVQLAERARVPQAAISRLESGGYQAINMMSLIRLADALSTTVDYLLQRADEAGEVPEKHGAVAVA
jgi:transcriptional regulator with XRE-family HTH domain